MSSGVNSDRVSKLILSICYEEWACSSVGIISCPLFGVIAINLDCKIYPRCYIICEVNQDLASTNFPYIISSNCRIINSCWITSLNNQFAVNGRCRFCATFNWQCPEQQSGDVEDSEINPSGLVSTQGT